MLHVCVPQREYSSSRSMTFLGVSHPTSSFCTTPHPLSPPTETSLHRTGMRYSTENATPRLDGSSGPMADSERVTGCEPKTCIDVSSEKTPINIAVRRDSFDIESDLNFAVSEDSDHLPQRAVGMRALRETRQEHKLIEIKIQQIDRVSMNTLKGKLKRTFKEKAQLGEDYLMLKTILNSGDWNRQNQNSHYTGLIENLNLKDGLTSGESLGGSAQRE